MTKCYICDEIIDKHSIHELQKCLVYSRVHQEKLDKLILKLMVLMG